MKYIYIYGIEMVNGYSHLSHRYYNQHSVEYQQEEGKSRKEKELFKLYQIQFLSFSLLLPSLPLQSVGKSEMEEKKEIGKDKT